MKVHFGRGNFFVLENYVSKNIRSHILVVSHHQLVSFADSSVQGRLDWIPKLGQGREDFVHWFPG